MWLVRTPTTGKNWLPLFSITNFYPEIYRWFDIIRQKHYRICGYVVMPNHLHFITFTPLANVNLNVLVSNGKRFMAYEIVTRLRQLDETSVLKSLSESVTTSDRKRGKLHQVFRPSFDGKGLHDERLILQKLDYIHHNPVSGKWNLANDYLSYPHSSARYYETGIHGPYVVTDYRKLLLG